LGDAPAVAVRGVPDRRRDRADQARQAPAIGRRGHRGAPVPARGRTLGTGGPRLPTLGGLAPARPRGDGPRGPRAGAGRGVRDALLHGASALGKRPAVERPPNPPECRGLIPLSMANRRVSGSRSPTPSARHPPRAPAAASPPRPRRWFRPVPARRPPAAPRGRWGR